MSARRVWAWPLVPVYWAAVAVKDGLRRLGVLRVRRLEWPVVSVGSLSAGGAGKTPVVIALAGMLKARGWTVDVLSRGYGRISSGVQRVDAKAEHAAIWFGDEPAMIAGKIDVPVWVGAERFWAGRLAEEAGRLLPQTITHPSAENAEGWATRSVRGLHVLDDGFQHRKLARALDVVLVTAEDMDDALLPAGNLREGWGALKRADVVVVREEEFDAVSKRVWPLVREGTTIWTVRRTLRFPAPRCGVGAGLRPLAFCAIARPEGFAALLRAAGCGIVDTLAFADHTEYTEAEIGQLVETAARLKTTGFVTTEKDEVKLSKAMRARLEAVGPVVVVSLDAVFGDGDAVIEAIEAKLA